MDNDDKQNPNAKSSWRTITMLLIAALLALGLVGWMNSYLNSRRQQELSYNELVTMVEIGDVESIKIGNSEITVIPKSGDTKYSRDLNYYMARMPGDYEFVNQFLKYNVDAYQEKNDTGTLLLILLNYAVPFLFLLFPMNFIMKRMSGGGITGVGKSNTKMYMQKETGITFKDVVREGEAKEPLIEIVDFLHSPGKYTKIGAKLPEGTLLVGPPGTGKTLLAKAVAGEAYVPFYSLSGFDFVEMFVGMGASHVHDLFENATENTPCIIFIDEIDAISRSRSSRMGGDDEREQTLNQFLSEMGSFDSTKGLLILAATNRPGILDPALLRLGYFDHRVIVDKPDLNEHINVLEVHSKDVLLNEGVGFKEIVLATFGTVGADLTNMMNEAAISAIKRGRSAVSQKDLFEAVEMVLVGEEKKDRIVNKEERRIVSYYEVDHALVSVLQEHSEPIQKIAIVPRTMDVLGCAMNVPEEKKYLNTEKELETRLVKLMAGRAAEEVVFETAITGAANDIRQATSVARAMVTQYGMSDKFGFMSLESQEDQYLTGRNVLNYGGAAAVEIDQEVIKILKDSYQKTIRLLSDNKDAVDQTATFLIEKETIADKEFTQIFRRVKGIPEPEGEKTDEDAARKAETYTSEQKDGDHGPDQRDENHGSSQRDERQTPDSGAAKPQSQVQPDGSGSGSRRDGQRLGSGEDQETIWNHLGDEYNK